MRKSVKTAIKFLMALNIICLPSMTLETHGATVDECAEVARSYGVSETAIQSAYNAYYANPEAYTSEKLDNVIRTLNLYGSDSDIIIKEYFGISDDGTSDETSSDGTVSNGNDSETDNSENNNPENNNSENNNSEYVSPIESSEFINMTIDDKIEFVSSLPEDDRAEFIENLTTEERNSIIKQLPIEDKTELLSKFVEAGSEMGLNMTIDEITDDSVSLSIRNDDGTLIDQSSLGVIVEDTGYDYRMLFTAVGTCLLLSSVGIYLIFRKFLKDKNNNER